MKFRLSYTIRRGFIFIFVFSFFVSMLVGCSDDRQHITVEPYQLVGLWQKFGTQTVLQGT